MEGLWHKNANVYTIDVQSFADGNDDGVGDFLGLSRKLDYLSGLNVSCIWLQPFYPSPRRDHGYDISDYYSIDPRYGTLGEFVEFSQAARDRGIRIIADLVVNHTSREHPWFQQARRDKGSKYRDWYVWSKEKPPDAEQGMAFPGVQKTTWTYDDAAGEYYFHRFYDHQPDLNTSNPAVRAEIARIIKAWVQLGVCGFRLDALPFVITTKGPGSTAFGDCPEYLIDMRQVLSWQRGDAVFMAEANLPPDQVEMYFGEGDRVHVIFNFYVNQHLWLALARGEAQPIRDAYRALPTIPKYCQWGNFLRTHDELDLGRLSEAERAEVFRAFGPEPAMQLYNRGIRRRVAPMLGNDRRRLELAHSLIFTLPGTPVLRYGDEIGMGEDLSLNERDSIRTPMQWADMRHAGFSRGERLEIPVIENGEFGYPNVNVAAQQRDPNSFLNWFERMTRLRLRSPEFGTAECHWLEASDPAVLAHCCASEESCVFAIHNLSAREIDVKISLGRRPEGLFDVLRDCAHPVAADGRQQVHLKPYGYLWLRDCHGPDCGR
ncbi:MAG TPA: alpha-amylase family protein [Bryobacteraceae bacterium]|nr:alpha-amylase family protein [Bryobacteraceae bacterium]